MTKLYNKLSTRKFRKSLRNNMPFAERLLWSRLKSKQLNNLKFRRQYSIGKYVLDFYCVEKRLAVELDGDSHYLSEYDRESDIRRDQYLGSIDIKVLHFTNNEIYNNLDGVLEKITSPNPSLSRRGVRDQ